MLKTFYPTITDRLKKIISVFSLPFTSYVVVYRVLKTLVIFFVLIASAIGFLLLSSESSEAGWWDDNWNYRKKITVTNNTSSENNVYVTLSSYNTSDTSRYQADCGDIRFTKSNGQLMKYYIVSGCGGASTTIHIQFDTLAVGAQDIYLYYGNTTAVNGTEAADFSTAATNATVGTPASEEKSPGPVGYWSFDEGYGTTGYNSVTGINNAAWADSSAASAVKIDDSGDPGSISGSARQLVRTSSGGLYAFINDGGSCEMWKSIDGTTWTEKGTAKTCTNLTAVSMAIDSTDTLHVLYIVSTTNLTYTTFDTSSETFAGSTETIFSSDPSMGVHAIAIDSSNVPHVLFATSVPVPTTVRVRYNNRVGGTWSSPLTPDSVSQSTTFRGLDLTINEDDIPEGSWINGWDSDVTAGVGNQADPTSFTLTDIDADVTNTHGSSIAIDSSGNTWVAYLDNLATDYITLVKHNDADAWATWQTPINDATAGTEPEIAIDGSNVYVFYQNSTDDIAYDVYNGSWSGETIVDTGGATVYRDTHVKWSFYHNNLGSLVIDYLFSDATDIWYNRLLIGSGVTPTWKSADSCLSSHCLYFEGSDDAATVTNANILDFDTGLTNGFTFSAMVRANSDGENSVGEIFSKGSNTYVRVDSEGSDGYADLEVNLDLATTDANVNVTDGITLNKWHHVAVTHDGTSSITVYIDGINKGSNTGSGSKPSDVNNLLIGGSSSANFHGYIDEVRVYQSARSGNQIKLDQIERGSRQGVSAQFGDNGPDDQLSSGLLAWWKLDESSGNASDSSGNSNTLTNYNSTSYTTGKYGNGSDHVQASAQYLGKTDEISSVKTVSFWVNPDSTTNYYMKLNANAYVGSSSGTISTTGFQNAKTYVNGIESAIIASGAWQNVTITADSVTAGDVEYTSTNANIGNYADVYCPTATDCKIAYYDNAEGNVIFVDCDNADCSSFTDTVLDGAPSGNALTGASDKDAGQYIVIDCSLGASDCKIAYRDATNSDLYFADCDTASCSSGTVTLLDGAAAGNALTGASNRSVGNYISIDCSNGTSDCKIAYLDSTNSDLNFADCDTATCSSGTATKLDGGSSGNSLTGAGNRVTGYYTSIDCSSGTSDCKISYIDFSNSDLYFADCDTATCSSGTATVLDGGSSNALSGASNRAISFSTSIECPATDDCKISYYYYNTGYDLYFADCSTASCSSGSTTLLDGAAAGNALTGAGDRFVGVVSWIDCTGGASDCKIAYADSVDGDIYFADCNSASCSSGTTTKLDGGSSGNALTNATNTSVGSAVALNCSSGVSDCKLVYVDSTYTAIAFGDCSAADCSSGTTTHLGGYDNAVGKYSSIYCLSATDCKISYYDSVDGDLKFADCDTATCSSATVTILDGATSGNALTGGADKDTGQYTSIYCPATDDCKISYYDVTNGDLYFADCDTATCSSGTATKLDGGASGNALTGAANAVTGTYSSIDCTGGASDCKISYYEGTNGDLYFADCDTATCSSGTATKLDGGSSGNSLTGAANKLTGSYSSIDCSAASTDCKISYLDSTNGDLYFADCDTATCSSGTATKLDGGASGNALTGASSKVAGQYSSIDCLATDDCKISYFDGTNNDLYFADCDTATCSTGTATKLDGGVSGNALTGASSYNAGTDSSIDCPASTDCKISYYVGSNQDLYFADCATATCSSGTTTAIDGTTGSALTGAVTKVTGTYSSISCSAGASDCKLSYFDGGYEDLSFADCDADGCTSGTTLPADIGLTKLAVFKIGATASNYLDGMMDEVRLYNRALSPTEVKALYKWSPGPVSHWSMDENSDSTLIPDSSGNDHTFIGGTGILGTPTLLDNGSNGQTGSQTQTTASFSPTVGKKLLIYVFSACENHTSGFNWGITASAGDTPTVKQTSSVYAMGPETNFNTQSILYELTVSSSGSRTFTFDANSSSSSAYNYSYAVVEVDNGSYAQTVVANGANINPQSSSASGSLTLGSNPVSGNLVMAFAGKYNLVSGALSTPTSYNTLINQSQTYTGVGSFYRNDTTSPTVSFTDLGQTVGAWSGFVLELAASTTSFSWSPGKYGSSLSLDGQGFGTLSDDADLDFGTGSFTIAGWVNHLTMSGGADYILTKSQIGTNGGYQVYMASDGDIVFEIDDDSAWGPDDSATTTAATYDDGTWHHIAAVKNETTGIYVYVDGVIIGSDTTIAATGTLTNDDSLNLGIGDDESSGAFAGMLDDIRIYNYARTPGQIVEDMNGGHPLGGSPVGSEVAYWGFDEGSLNTCSGGSNDFCDQTANANDLALGQTTAGYTTNGKFGLAFDGSATYWASRSDDDDFDVGIIDDLTVSLWFRSDAASLPGATEYLVNKSNTTTQGYAIYTTTAGYVCFGIDDDGSWGPDIASCNSTNLYDASWHHVVGVRDHSLTDKTYVYVDGRLIDSDSDTTTATLANTLSLYVKDDDGDSTNSFAGDIDELKIYRGALTSEEVLIDYNRGASSVLGSISTESNGTTASNTAAREYCVPGDMSSCSGPVGEWKLDEGTGTTSTYDTSGNGRTGSLMSITQTAWSPGKHGSSLILDGSADYVDIGTGPSTVKTATFWVYPETTTEYFLNFTGTTDYIWLNNGTVTATGFTSPSIYVNGLSGASISAANKWYYVAVTSSTAENASNFDIGRVIDALYLQGKIDQVRLYDYVRIPAQIAWEYNKGEPVAYYALDECQGSTAYNSIADGNGDPSGNNGSIYSLATGTNTSVGTCSSDNGNEMWDNGTTGKLNGSLEFDDTNDYVQVADANTLDLTSGLSISAWVNTDASEADNVIVSKGTSYEVGINADGDIYWEGASSQDDASTKVTSGTWHHVVVTNDDTTVTYYVDGVETGTDASGVGADNSTVLMVGSDGTNYFDGQIDEVGIYNFVLTDRQIKTIYVHGAVRFE